MYYIKLPINKVVYTNKGIKTRSTSVYDTYPYYEYTLQTSNDSAFFTIKKYTKASTYTNEGYIFISKCKIIDDYCLIPITKYEDYYYSDNMTNVGFDIRNGFTNIRYNGSYTKISSFNIWLDISNYIFYKYDIVDDDYSVVGQRYIHIIGLNDKAYILVKDNPNEIKVITSSLNGTSNSTTDYTSWINMTTTNKRQYTDLTINATSISQVLSLTELITLSSNYGINRFPEDTTSYAIQYGNVYGGLFYNGTKYIKTSLYRKYKDVISFTAFNNNMFIPFLGDEWESITINNIVINNDFYNDNANKCLIVNIDNSYYIYLTGKGNDTLGELKEISIFLKIESSKSSYNTIESGYSRYYSSDGTYLYYNMLFYQEPYTPTNKLKTPTFSDLNVLHNEDTGTYALTFKANNPNDVSVSVDITISGREGTDNITLPSGDSEWSFLLPENKAGTLQGTNISALGYENADDTSKYNYYEWVAPGYLREIVISLCYLSTIDDKNYNLTILYDNPNGIEIPCVVHYGKNGENASSKTLVAGGGFFTYPNVENVNGFVYIHPEKVDGYYQLPDTEAVSYTKLPIPPTPSSTGITLYKNNNNNKVVNKGYKLETYKVLNGTFRDSVNILNPVFQIENDEVPECNYCYIADFRRYYYIDTITCIRTGLYEIECSVDVLYTYKDSILNSEQYISRQENEYNELLKDDMVTFDSSYDYNIYYQNIDELDYGIATGDVMKDYDRTNILVSWFGIQS